MEEKQEDDVGQGMMKKKIPIVYLTGPTASGKGTLGKMLADRYGLYHISITTSPSATRGGTSSDGSGRRASAPISGTRVEKAREVLVSNMDIGDGAAGDDDGSGGKSGGAARPGKKYKYKAILLDGFPVTTGDLNRSLVAELSSHPRPRPRPPSSDPNSTSTSTSTSPSITYFSGLTIVIECPEHIAKGRYLNRERLATDSADKFEERMDRTRRCLEPFVRMMEDEFGSTVVRFVNAGEEGSVERAFEGLERVVKASETFRRVVGLS
ncbi:hypothetical protein F5Y17DRAFT_471353 [Xylariaceae sp. FL0594]|nr:hypothetical protein F5Y17DRAFT_471353 [Xylariaceae sp. FL0594]